MRIAVAQMNTRAGDFEFTAQTMLEYAQRAQQQGAELVIYPAPTLTGLLSVPEADTDGLFADLSETINFLSEKLPIAALIPVVTEFDGNAASEVFLVRNGAVTPLKLTAQIAHMSALARSASSSQDSNEDTVELAKFEAGGLTFGIAFTYEDLDAWQDVDDSLDAVIYLPFFGFAVDDSSSAMGMAVAESRYLGDVEEFDSWLIAANAVGAYGNQVFCGSSFFLSPSGDLVKQAASFSEDMVVCDVDQDTIENFDREDTAGVYNSALTTWGVLATGVRDYTVKSGFDGVFIAVDGSLNSLVTVALASDALGPMRVHVLLLPNKNSRATSAAELLAARLRVNKVAVDSTVFSTLTDTKLVSAYGYTYADQHNYLTLETADKTILALKGTEISSAHSLWPLGDMYHADIVDLARVRNTFSPAIDHAVLENISEVVTDGLENAASTSQERIEFVDYVLTSYLEWNKSISAIVEEMGKVDEVKAIISMLHAHQKDRRNTTEVLEMSSKSLMNAQIPHVSVWQDRIRDTKASESKLVESLRNSLREIQGTSIRLSELSVDPTEAREGFKDMLELLKELAQETDTQIGIVDPKMWRGPFSEN
ncbi:amidohydrolase-like protein [Lancefieldella parvula DSM 20469]|uniref:Amidohydrolase-like protein n=1 Tax=Lancefieldella parvula (strain ATCC 33793 / DSM 20469 / CCUG 32760 / JCM 10300 / KCTC 3663 / VPI 0546 / 1246) TaxID=521095 RepID=C8W786_LANP1|nr:nitrilase-related carbon-nitrogen hydrolase [Lancefieldella parvula]ACV51325.1 amidohydrolase-like protein [Lancefieldella parvula DSM 20469]